MSGSRWTWRLVALPGVVWLSVFFLVAFYAVLAVAFGNQDTLSQPVPHWNPLDWNVGYVSDMLDNLVHGGPFWTVSLRTIEFVALAVGLSLLIGYPVAYFTAMHAGRWKGAILLALILPLWINYLMRMLAWVNLLQTDGYVNDVSAALGFGRVGWLDGRPVTVILGLAYGYVPFLVLPLFAALDRIDPRLLEASRDLGMGPAATFLRVTLPLSRQGMLAAAVITALPMTGDFYTTDLLSGSPRTNMIGNQIEFYLFEGSEKASGAALVLILSGALLIAMAYYLRSIDRSARELR
jgi:spermidine/putrescine transport system permease protein